MLNNRFTHFLYYHQLSLSQIFRIISLPNKLKILNIQKYRQLQYILTNLIGP